jgi:hypothetical protein
MLPDTFIYTISASETEEGKKRLSEYYEALGRFVDLFSRLEAAVTFTLWHYAKTSPDIAKIIFAGAKIEVGSAYIKQLAKATAATQELQDDLEYVLQQVGDINSARNFILHYGAESVAEGNAFVTNALKAKGEPTSFPISPTILDQMSSDLRKISLHLNYRHLGRLPLRSAEVSDSLNEAFRAPWQYKHPVQPKERSKTESVRQIRKRGPKPPRPPRPSRASRRKAALDRKT